MEDSDGPKEIYGPQCWDGVGSDGGLKTTMWVEIVTEFNFSQLYLSG